MKRSWRKPWLFLLHIQKRGILLMELKIKNRTVEVKFGMRFLAELDKLYEMRIIGPDGEVVEVEAGLRKLFMNIQMGNIAFLRKVIYAGTRTSKAYKPTWDDIDDYLDSVAEYEPLIDEIKQELEDANATKKMWNEMVNSAEEETENLEEVQENE